MAVLATLKKERLGDWATLGDYLAQLRRRETNAVAALALTLSAAEDEQRELGRGEGLPLLIELASDLRMPKASRVAAARCAIEGGATGEALGALFVGAGDLATDARLGTAARKLVEEGLSVALQNGQTRVISMQAGAFARAAEAAVSVLGKARVEELLASAAPGHSGAAAARFAIGAAELPPPDRERWVKVLREVRTANRSAPAAARRLGLAPPWPPNVPEAFALLVREADEATADLTAVDAAAAMQTKGDAAKNPVSPPPGNVGRPGASERPGPTVVEVGKKLAPPIKQSAARRPRGTVTEGPVRHPPKPMPPVGGRQMPAAIQAIAAKTEAKGAPPPAPPAARLRRARVAPGRFAARLEALFEDRPEAVERLCAAMEAREALLGHAAALGELDRELSSPRWRDRRASDEQLARLAAAAQAAPSAWRAAAGLLLARLR